MKKLLLLILLMLVLSGCSSTEEDKVACLYNKLKQEEVDRFKADRLGISYEEYVNRPIKDIGCTVTDGERWCKFTPMVTSTLAMPKYENPIKCQQVPDNRYWEETLPPAEDNQIWILTY